MIKVVIFENEFQNIKASFDAVNLLYFDNKLDFRQFSSSQDFGEIKNAANYEFAVVDIDLSPKSNLDGYQIISQILALKSITPRLIVLTGHIDIRDQLRKRGFPNLHIISKPVTHEDIRKAFQKSI